MENMDNIGKREFSFPFYSENFGEFSAFFASECWIVKILPVNVYQERKEFYILF